MVRWEYLVLATETVTYPRVSDSCRPPNTSNAASVQESPSSSSSQGNNDIRISLTNFLIEPLQFGSVLSANIFTGHQCGLVRDTANSRAAQVLNVVVRARAQVEAVGDKTFAASYASLGKHLVE